MTVIVRNCATKKGLRLAARAMNDGILGLQFQPKFNDPAIVNALFRGDTFAMENIPNCTTFVCTNHPKRSWFAEVIRDHAGKFVVR